MRGPEPPGGCGGEAPEKRGPGRSKDARETIGFSTRHDVGKRQAVELARPHLPPGRAPGITMSTYELRQANPGLALRRCPRPRQ